MYPNGGQGRKQCHGCGLYCYAPQMKKHNKECTELRQCNACKKYIPKTDFQNHINKCPKRSKQKQYNDSEESKPDFIQGETDIMKPSRFNYRDHADYMRENIADEEWAKLDRKTQKSRPDMGIEHLKRVVGSKLGRDVIRRDYLVSKNAFDEWAKEKDKKQRYWGDYMDVDSDSEDEFVVGYNEMDDKGKVILDEEGNPKRTDRYMSVNGWTTINTDYPTRKAYYDKYPTPASRKSKSFNKFMREHYITDDDKDDYGFPNHNYIEKRRKAMYENKYTERTHMPLPNARQAFMSELIRPACTSVLKQYCYQNGKEYPEDVTSAQRKKIGELGADLWHEWIEAGFFETNENDKFIKDAIEAYKKKFDNAPANKNNDITFDRTNPVHLSKFLKNLLKKDSVRVTLNRLTSKLLKDDNLRLPAIEEVKHRFDAKLRE